MKIRIGLVTIAAIVLECHFGFTQSTPTHTVFIEGSTRGPSYSLNYDRIFYSGTKVSYAYRIGLHWLNDEIALPIGVSLITGKGTHHGEISLTATPLVDRAKYLFRSGNYSDKKIYLTPGLGYRFQKSKGGFFAKAVAGPTLFLDPRSDNFWKMDPKLFFVLSVGAGYTF